MTSAHSRRTAGWIPARGPGRTRSSGAAAAQLRPLARRVHFLAGLLVAPFLLILCLTGLVYVFSPQVHNDLYSGQLFVSQVGAARHPVADQVAAALRAHPEARVQSVVPPSAPERTTRVNLQVPGLNGPRDARTVFVDPYTDYINGELVTSDGRLPANVWLRELHASLHLGAIGRLYSELAASWLPVIAVGGLIGWISKQGRRRRSAAEMLVPAPRGKGEVNRLRSVHGPLGIWLTAGLLVMSATGLVMSPLAGWGLPGVREPTLAVAAVAVTAEAPIGIDDVLAVAAADGLTGELLVTPPAAPDRPYTVVETSVGLPIRKGEISVDPYTAHVTERIGWDDYPALAQLREIGVQFHTGTLFGLANQILLTLVVLGTIGLIVGGYRMWWKRNPFRATASPGPPPALAALSWPVALGVATAVAVLGWLLPVFGISLLAFLMLDLLIRAIRDRAGRGRKAAAAGAFGLAAALLAFVALPAPTPITGQLIGAAAPEAASAPAPGPSGPAEPAHGSELHPWSAGIAPHDPRSSAVSAAPNLHTGSAAPGHGAAAAGGAASAAGPSHGAEGAHDQLPAGSAADAHAVHGTDGSTDGNAVASTDAGAHGSTDGSASSSSATDPATDRPAGSSGLVTDVVGILTSAVPTDLVGNPTGQLLRR